MASAERETEESRVRGVAAEVAAAGSSRFAGVARHQTTRSSSPSGQRSAERAPTPRTRATGRLPAAALAVDRRSSRPPPVSAIYSALPSAGVSSSLRRATALPGICCLPGRAGLPAVHQCRLEDGAARHLDRMERPGAAGQPSPRRQQRTLPDPALGRSAAFGQSHSVFSSPSTPHRLDGLLRCSPPAVGDPGEPALYRDLLPGRQLDLCGPDSGPRPHGSHPYRPRQFERHPAVSAEVPLARTLMPVSVPSGLPCFYWRNSMNCCGPGTPSSRNNALGNVHSGWLMVCSCASARI